MVEISLTVYHHETEEPISGFETLRVSFYRRLLQFLGEPHVELDFDARAVRLERRGVVAFPIRDSFDWTDANGTCTALLQLMKDSAVTGVDVHRPYCLNGELLEMLEAGEVERLICFVCDGECDLGLVYFLPWESRIGCGRVLHCGHGHELLHVVDFSFTTQPEVLGSAGRLADCWAVRSPSDFHLANSGSL